MAEPSTVPGFLVRGISSYLNMSDMRESWVPVLCVDFDKNKKKKKRINKSSGSKTRQVILNNIKNINIGVPGCHSWLRI